MLLNRLVDRAVAILLAEVFADGFMHIADRKHRALHALANPVVEQPLEERSSLHWCHRLRHVADRSTQPRAQAAGEDDCFHL